MQKMISLFALFVLACLVSHSQPGTPLSTFGSGGLVTNPQYNPGYIEFGSLYVVSGPNLRAEVPGLRPGPLVELRYDLTGRLVNTNTRTATDYVFAGEQPDGHLVYRFQFGDTIYLRRTDANNVVDNTFGKNGLARMYLNRRPSVAVTVIQDDGKIICAGNILRTDANNNFISSGHYLARFNADGTIDSTYGTNGAAIYPTSAEIPRSILLQPDGKVILGSTWTGTPPQAFYRRYNTDGSQDNSFFQQDAISNSVNYHKMAIQSDGKIIIRSDGYDGVTGSPRDYSFTRFNADGSVDNTLGYDWIITTQFAPNIGIFTQDNGKVLIVGSDSLARFNADATRDQSFGTGGSLKVQNIPLLKDFVYGYAAKVVDTLYLSGYVKGSPNVFALAAIQLGDAPSLQPCMINGGRESIYPDQTTTWSGPEGMDSYLWSGPGGFTATTKEVTISSAGDYYLTTEKAGVRYQCSRTLNYSAVQVCLITASTGVICAGTTTTWSGPEGMDSYLWTSPNGFSATTREVTLSAAGNYFLVTEKAGVRYQCAKGLLVTPVPTSTISLTGSSATTIGGGLTYRYYEGSWTQLPDFGGLKPVETGQVTKISLTPRKRNDQFAFLFQGMINIPKAGTYYFETSSDDGSKLYIGGYGHYVTPVVDNDGQHADRLRGGWYTFPAAGQYEFALTYFEQLGAEQLNVYWGSTDAGIPMHTPIPDEAFGAVPNPTSNLTYQYYEGIWTRLPDFGGLTPVARGKVSNVSLTPKKRDEQFAFLFQGKINIPKAGRYYFETASDDGSRLYIGGWGHYVTPVVDNDGMHGTETKGGWYTFPSAGQYDFAVSYFEQGGEEVLKVYWGSEDAGIPMHTPIPDEAFGAPGMGSCGTSTLTASAGDSYLWSTGETTRSIQVSTPGAYSVTITKDGCSATATTTVVCATTLPAVKKNREETAPATLSTTLSLFAAPNPSATQFSLHVQGLKQGTPATLIVSDALGRIVERKIISYDGQFVFGLGYHTGFYHAELVQGAEHKIIKLIKTRK